MADPRVEIVGRVTGFFAKPSVAVLALTSPVSVGELLFIKGHTTDFQQRVESLQIDQQAVRTAPPGGPVGLRVSQRCRRHDVVYRLVV